MRALLVVNPKATATTARARDVLAHALASQARLEVVQTKTRGHATELAQAAVGEFDVVVALGGDGTVNEVVNGLLADGVREGLPALGVVPGGSTNVFARALGLPNSPVEATGVLLDALASERRRSVGLGLAAGRWFTFNAGLGLDGHVVRRVNALRGSGHPATPALYVRATLREFFTAVPRHRPTLTLEREGAEPEQLCLALVCTGPAWTYLGGRALRPCPRGSFDLGLDVLGLRRLGVALTLRHLAQVMSAEPRPHGRHVVAVHDAAELVLSSASPQPLQLDGEDLGDHTRVVVRRVPRALQLVL